MSPKTIPIMTGLSLPRILLSMLAVSKDFLLAGLNVLSLISLVPWSL